MQSSIRLDHLATWNEVCDALMYLSRDALELVHAREADGELNVAVSNGVGTLSEELAWLRIANESLDSSLN